MLLVLFASATIFMVLGIVFLISSGAARQHAGDKVGGGRAALAFMFGALLIEAQAAMWVVFGLKYGGAW